MSKNTGTSELINYFDLGANGDVGIAGSLDINTIANATTDTDTFLVSDTGIIKYRTGAQLLSDIGAQGALTNPVTGTGTSGTIPIFTGSTTLGDSIIQANATQVNVVGNGSQLLFDSLGSSKSGGIWYVNDFELLINNSRGTGSAIQLGNTNLNLITNSTTRLTITDTGTATFSGALNGTSITLSGDYNSTSNSGSLLWSGATNKVQLNANAGTLDFYTGTSGYTKQLSISPTGAATFSNSITTSGNINVNSDGIFINRSTSGEPYVFFQKNGVNRGSIYGVTGGGLRIFDESDNQVLTITGTNVLIGTQTDSGHKLRVNGTALISSSYNNFQTSSKTASSGGTITFTYNTDYNTGSDGDNTGGLIIINVNEANTNANQANAVYIATIINPRGTSATITEISRRLGAGVTSLTVAESGNNITVTASISGGGNFRATLTFIGGSGIS